MTDRRFKSISRVIFSKATQVPCWGCGGLVDAGPGSPEGYLEVTGNWGNGPDWERRPWHVACLLLRLDEKIAKRGV